jgi:hypothetical protein
MVAVIPLIKYALIFSWMQFRFVPVVPKYVNFVVFSNDYQVSLDNDCKHTSAAVLENKWNVSKVVTSDTLPRTFSQLEVAAYIHIFSSVLSAKVIEL